jgi:hypothetical protein
MSAVVPVDNEVTGRVYVMPFCKYEPPKTPEQIRNDLLTQKLNDLHSRRQILDAGSQELEKELAVLQRKRDEYRFYEGWFGGPASELDKQISEIESRLQYNGTVSLDLSREANAVRDTIHPGSVQWAGTGSNNAEQWELNRRKIELNKQIAVQQMREIAWNLASARAGGGRGSMSSMKQMAHGAPLQPYAYRAPAQTNTNSLLDRGAYSPQPNGASPPNTSGKQISQQLPPPPPALPPPPLPPVPTRSASAGLVVFRNRTIKLYRKMSTEEAETTLREMKLQPKLPGQNGQLSEKYLSESEKKVQEFQNSGVAKTGTKEVVLEFTLDKKGYDDLMQSSVKQYGSKGIDAIKYHFEGLNPSGNLRNIGVPSSQLEKFNSVIIDIKPTGK